MSIITTRALRPMRRVLAALAALALSAGIASAQTYGFATMQPGTLNHTTASAIAKVLKEKGGMNVAGAADRRRIDAHSAGRPRRGRNRHRQYSRSGRSRQRQATRTCA